MNKLTSVIPWKADDPDYTRLSVGPGRYRAPRHRMPLNSSYEELKCLGMAYVVRHVIGCHTMSMTWRAISARP